MDAADRTHVRPVSPSLLLLPISLAIALLLPACGLADITATLDESKVTQVSLEAITGELHLTVTNPSTTPIELGDIMIHLAMGAGPLMDFHKPGPTIIKGQTANHLVLPMALDWTRVHKLVEKIQAVDELPVEAHGTIVLKTFLGDPNFVFELTTRLPLKTFPTVTAPEWALREVAPARVLADIVLKMENTGRSDFALRELHYKIGLKHLNLIDGHKETVTLMVPGASFWVKLPLQIDIASIRRTGMDKIVIEKLAQLKMRHLATLGTALGDSPGGAARLARYATDALGHIWHGESMGKLTPPGELPISLVDLGLAMPWQATATAQTVPTPTGPEPAFVRERRDACVAYGLAANDIRRSAIYADYFEKQDRKPLGVTGLNGTLTKIATSRGGGIVLLAVATPWGSFGNNDFLQGGFVTSRREIRKGTKFYNRVGDLAEGQAVTFTGKLMAAEKETSELLSLCGDGWLIQFTEIRPNP